MSAIGWKDVADEKLHRLVGDRRVDMANSLRIVWTDLASQSSMRALVRL